ncbi:hypothetical protein RDI58_017759 [Solanum bulbocastanum]|uniref:Uncharacterized protein n=1 Tax=Solanum bulbocastanum TaxID=147425 RepID=A0AAN8TAF1_SOLBU
MMQAREQVEHQVLWQPRRGSSSIWNDNWIGLGDLHTITWEDFEWDDKYEQVDDLTKEGEWNEEIVK